MNEQMDRSDATDMLIDNRPKTGLVKKHLSNLLKILLSSVKSMTPTLTLDKLAARLMNSSIQV